MCGSQGYIQYFTVLLLLALCSIQQVSSIECFACSSITDPDCSSTANQTKFKIDCSRGPRSYSHFYLSSLDVQVNQRAGPMEYVCGYARGISSIDNAIRVERGCAEISKTCHEYKKITKRIINSTLIPAIFVTLTFVICLGI